jgi:hypothetical protein
VNFCTVVKMMPPEGPPGQQGAQLVPVARLLWQLAQQAAGTP